MRIKDLATRATKLLTGNAYMVFDNGTKVEKVDYAELAKQIITEYNTQTLAGSAQSVKSALDALNSKTPANPTVLTASDDMNNITTPGVYAQWNDNTPLHAPTTQYNATILVYNMRPYEVWQIWASANTKDVWTRMKAGGNWTEWTKMPTRAEMDAVGFKANAGTSGTTFNLSNGYRGILYIMDSTAERCGEYIVWTTGAGAFGKKDISAASDVTIASSASGQVTITANTGNRVVMFSSAQGTVSVAS